MAQFGPGRYAVSPLFVPRCVPGEAHRVAGAADTATTDDIAATAVADDDDGDDDDDDDGYILTFVYDSATHRSDLAILDAARLGDGPCCVLRLPTHVPYSFHGTWVPASEGGGVGW